MVSKSTRKYMLQRHKAVSGTRPPRIQPLHYRYTYTHLQQDIRKLSLKLEKVKFDLIIGINRGGMIPAIMLSHRLKKPVFCYDPRYLYPGGNRKRQCILVDDIYDRGNTYSIAWSTLSLDVYIEAGVFLVSRQRHLLTGYYGRHVPHTYKWVDFWWAPNDKPVKSTDEEQHFHD